MNNLRHLTIVSQMPGQKKFDQGIFEGPVYVAGIDPSLGLMAISSSQPGGIEASPARMAMEILMDDMQTNIPQFVDEPVDSKKSAMGVNCLQESLDNINEYLYGQVGEQYDSTSVAATQLSAFQYLNGNLSYILGAGIKCLLLQNNKLKELSNASSHLAGALGEKPLFESRVEEEALAMGDILCIASVGDISVIGEDFIRLTLIRFPKNLDTALRQINTKATRQDMKEIPGIILCRINQQTGPKKSWMERINKAGVHWQLAFLVYFHYYKSKLITSS